jgi:KipI family sensor histidine kinase inhibitor
MAEMEPTTKFLDVGEAALAVEFGDRVDPKVHDQVLALDEKLTAMGLAGVRETVPTYRSLLVHYDPLVLGRAELIATIRGIESLADASVARKRRNVWTIPCCYETPFAEDLREIAAAAGLSEARVVELHSEARYRAYMYGFAPGVCYLGGLPKELDISRRPTPRAPHLAGAILIAGGLSLIGTFSMPTGWWVIGVTPVRMFAPTRQPTFLAEVGDEVRFRPVSSEEFSELDSRAAVGESVAQRETLR